jgi:hypothetical protein
MPKLFDDENVGIFMNIDERRHFFGTNCACPRENAYGDNNMEQGERG